MSSGGTSVLIVEEQDLLRQGLELIFARHREFDVVASVAGADEAIKEARRLSPHIVVLGPRYAKNGVCKTLTRHDPNIKVLLLAQPGAEVDALDSLRNGACGCLLTDVMAEDLVHAIRLVAQGQIVLPPSLARKALEKGEGGQRHYSGLSIRELEVLQLAANGLRNKEIAARLCLSEVTVKTHVSRILRKLGRSNRTAAILHAYRQGWIEIRYEGA